MGDLAGLVTGDFLGSRNTIGRISRRKSTWTYSRHLGDVFYPDCSRIMSNPAAGCPQIAGENRPYDTLSVPDNVISESLLLLNCP